MALQVGTRIGAYEIISPLGAGGMGEVYRGRDTKLQRDVALKILPETMARDAQRMARFEREAQVLASLNHPNIAAIYGLEESNGVRALVMELVEGETLGERLRRTQPLTRAASRDTLSQPAGRGEKLKSSPSGSGRPAGPGDGSPLGVDDALPIAKQIAEALEYAHERGVIHRDLKPANVKITPEGTVKVLDFGLAKVLESQDSTATMDMANSPTLSAMATQAGMILGTAAYMSPEQAKGQRVDRRADIWAFGCVLFEMLTGWKPFDGETITDVLASVIKSEPDWAAIPDTTPRTIQKLVRRCLQKDQRQRLQAIGEARITIEETISGSDSEAAISDRRAEDRIGGQRPPLQRVLPWVSGVLLVAGMAVTVAYLRLERAPTRAIVAKIPPPADLKFVFNSINASNAELSPDGSRLLFLASGAEGVERLWVLPLDSTVAQPLQGTEHAFTPFWSPDGRYVAFFADGKLKKVDIGGGAPVDLCDASWGRGGTWSEDGTILFAPNINSPIERVSAGGGTPVAVTTLDSSRGQTSHRWPQFLPDGQHFIFFSNSTPRDYAGTYAASLKGGEPKVILRGSSNAIYASGYLLFVDSGNLMAQRFDLSRLHVMGDPVAIRGKVGTLDVASRSLITASANGMLAYWSISGGSGSFQLEWFDRAGKQVGASGTPTYVTFSPRLSRDGKRLAIQVSPQPGEGDIWIVDLVRDTRTRLTFNTATNTNPVWSPDGTEIAFGSNRSGTEQIYVKSANGTGAATQLLKDNAVDDPESWSADGRYLAFKRTGPQRKFGSNLWILPLFGDRKPFPFIENSSTQLYFAFSPDVKWLAYASDETGRPEVYIAPFPKANGKWEVSTQGGVVPTWRQDGKELYYLSLDQKLMAVDIRENGDSIEIGSPHVLFQTNPPPLVLRSYDAVADGSKFIVVTQSLNASSVPVTLVVNWPALLKK